VARSVQIVRKKRNAETKGSNNEPHHNFFFLKKSYFARGTLTSKDIKPLDGEENCALGRKPNDPEI